MATDDKSKTKPKAGDAPKKKKKKRVPAPGTEASKESPQTASKALREVDEPTPTPPPAAAEEDEEESTALAVRGAESASLDAPAGEELGAPRSRPGALREPDEDAPAQLGVERYVLAAFFAGGLVGAYVLGRLIHGVWANLANRDFFSQNLPALAAVQDDTKTTIGIVIGGIISLGLTIYTYRRPDVREWADKVADELNKVKWPTKKDVTNSTMVVIAASAVATLYLALLDRLWAFVTNLVYGTGS